MAVRIHGGQLMTHLDLLAFVAVSKHSALNTTQIRRCRLVERLREQKRLASAPSYHPTIKLGKNGLLWYESCRFSDNQT